MRPSPFRTRVGLPSAPYAIYGMDDYGDGSMGGPILDIYDKVDLKDIIKSYQLELSRMAEVDALREKRRKKEEDRLKWEKIHIFPMKGNTAPTNPWKKLPKPGGGGGVS